MSSGYPPCPYTLLYVSRGWGWGQGAILQPKNMNKTRGHDDPQH